MGNFSNINVGDTILVAYNKNFESFDRNSENDDDIYVIDLSVEKVVLTQFDRREVMFGDEKHEVIAVEFSLNGYNYSRNISRFDIERGHFTISPLYWYLGAQYEVPYVEAFANKDICKEYVKNIYLDRLKYLEKKRQFAISNYDKLKSNYEKFLNSYE